MRRSPSYPGFNPSRCQQQEVEKEAIRLIKKEILAYSDTVPCNSVPGYQIPLHPVCDSRHLLLFDLCPLISNYYPNLLPIILDWLVTERKGNKLGCRSADRLPS
ncbi:unnamed protein product [Linum trigynum]|uniref:Uncharacterized protein n=1 Tax=Linum trigynum TaxID=586398 RepID=A0AAV2CKC6_9ROSI